MHTLGAFKCMHVVHSVGFRKVLVLGRHTLALCVGGTSNTTYDFGR